jgi:predicted O-linked N-acetylglucosamine transferase (SPINDLY family)
MIERATALDPGNPFARVDLGMAYQAAGSAARAEACLREAVAIAPRYWSAHEHLARLCYGQGRLEDALEHFDAVAQLEPQSAQAQVNRGVVLGSLRRRRESLAAFERAVALDAACVEGWYNLAQTLELLQRFDDTEQAYRRVLALRADHPGACYRLARVLHEQGGMAEAAALFDRAIALDANNAEFHWVRCMARIPPAYDDVREIEGARTRFSEDLAALERWFDAAPRDGSRAVGSMHPFYLAYPEIDNCALLSEYGDLCARVMDEWRARACAVRTTQHALRDRVRVGIVSGHFYDQSVWTAIVKGWCRLLDRERFELDVFYTGEIQDEETAVARSLADSFHVGLPTLDDWVKRIEERRPDVLLYPEIGMDRTTMRLAALRIAPVQWASWGHPETTGLPTIDAFLSAELLEPPEAERNYRERLVRLPNLGCRYAALDVPEAVVDVEGLRGRLDAPLVLCAGTPYKYLPQHDRVLVEIARRLGRCTLAFFIDPHSGLSAKLQKRLERAFAVAGLDAARYVRFLPRLARPDFFALMRVADLYLDTIGFSGFNTAMQAIQSGVPVVTYEGRFLRGRLASGILRRMRLHEAVATDLDQFVSLAVEACGAGRNAALRDRVLQSRDALFDDEAPVHALGERILEALRR